MTQKGEPYKSCICTVPPKECIGSLSESDYCRKQKETKSQTQRIYCIHEHLMRCILKGQVKAVLTWSWLSWLSLWVSAWWTSFRQSSSSCCSCWSLVISSICFSSIAAFLFSASLCKQSVLACSGRRKKRRITYKWLSFPFPCLGCCAIVFSPNIVIKAQLVIQRVSGNRYYIIYKCR